MWWKLSGLAFVEVVLVWFLTKPIPTHAVMYDPAKGPPDQTPLLPLLMQLAGYAAMLAVILIPLFAYWIFRRAPQP